MKSIQINFVEDWRWPWLWAGALLCSLGLLGTWLGRWLPIQQATAEQHAQITTLQQRLQGLNDLAQSARQQRQARQDSAQPRQASLAQAAQLLQQNPNAVFAAAENLQAPGFRLRSLSLQAGANRLRLEYELATLAEVAALSELLNGGDEQRPWQLENVSRASGNSAMGEIPMNPQGHGYRGVWSVALDRL